MTEAEARKLCDESHRIAHEVLLPVIDDLLAQGVGPSVIAHALGIHVATTMSALVVVYGAPWPGIFDDWVAAVKGDAQSFLNAHVERKH